MSLREQELLSRLGERVRSARRCQELTARELAERAGLSARFVSQLETGKANIAVGRLARVADALGVGLGALLDEDRPDPTGIVALLGLRGAGKSTVGPRLALALERRFVELDALIESEAGLSLSEIFALHGETYYRRLEYACLARLIEEDAYAVVALSGGIVHNNAAFSLVQTRCLSVWLEATPEDHMARVREQGDHRPMANRANAMAELRAILAEREPLYNQADIIIETTGATPKAVLDTVLSALRRP